MTDERTAFMSSALFMFFFWFYGASSPRQKQAELFLALLLLSTFQERSNLKSSALLSILFAFSLITSHYGTSYFFMLLLLSAFFVLSISKKLGILSESRRLFSSNFLLLYGIMVLAWYIYTAGSANFFTLVNFFNFFIEHLGELFSPEASHALRALTKNWNSVSIEILKYIMLFICGLIALGILRTVYRQIRERKLEELSILSASFLIMLGATLLPIGGGFDTFRIFHLTLILLAPFSVIGLKIALKRLSNRIASKHLILFAGLLAIFFLLNSGFIPEFIPNDYSPNAYINKEKIIASDNIQAKYLLYRDYYVPDQSIQSSEWIKNYSDTSKRIYSDILGSGVLRSSRFGQLPEEIRRTLPPVVILDKNMELKEDCYVFLAYHNSVEKRIFVIEEGSITSYSTDDLPKNMSKVYDNGAGKVFFVD
jgi:uncharacterized membrane protein